MTVGEVSASKITLGMFRFHEKHAGEDKRHQLRDQDFIMGYFVIAV